MIYQYCCVHPRHREELQYIVDHEKQITYKTFIKHVKGNADYVIKSLGYDSTFPIYQDWCVTFHKSKLPDGRPVYFICHSSIEYIFY